MNLRLRAALLSIVALLVPTLAAANDPSRTLTLYVHGFEQAGAGYQGVYGDTVGVAAMDSIAALVGLPVATSTESLPANAVLAVGYYGDTPPAYYSAADVAEVAAVTSQWGGGVPRYALIVAKFIDHVLATSGARQVHVVSASFGSLVTRWMIEKDVEGLASRRKVARWLTAEGVLSGNWAASRDEFTGWIEAIAPLPIDVDHMHYAWVEDHLHAPRTQADHPLYADILIGQVVSTDDGYLDGALSALMAGVGDYQPNDGVQALADARFEDVTARSMLLGRPPTLSLFPVDHYGLSKHRGAWAQVATFLTQRRRVRIVMTEAQVTDLHEPQQPYWDWRPAEVVFGSAVTSPAVRARWGITDPLSVVGRDGAVAPLRRYRQNGETQAVGQVVFDDLVLDSETQLELLLRADEIDYDAHYGVYETIGEATDALGSGSLTVSTRTSGTYTFAAGSWNGRLTVEVFEYPFEPALGVSDPPSPSPVGSLHALPNPHRGSVRLVVPPGVAVSASVPAVLRIFDPGGRCVRRIVATSDREITWDERDDAGRVVPAGVYLHRLDAGGQTWSARSARVR
jgi:hypothetical protein